MTDYTESEKRDMQRWLKDFERLHREIRKATDERDNFHLKDARDSAHNGARSISKVAKKAGLL